MLVQGNSDSDRSISDAEDFEASNCASSIAKPEKEGGLQLQSRLEVLIGARELCSDGNLVNDSRNEKSVGLPANDEVEMPDFCDEGGIIFSHMGEAVYALDNDHISDDEDSCKMTMGSIASRGKKLPDEINLPDFARKTHNLAHTQPMMSKSLEALLHENRDALSSCSAQPKAKKATKGSKFQTKPRFPLHFQCVGLGLSGPFISKEEAALLSKDQDVYEISETSALGFMEISNSDLEKTCGEAEGQGLIAPDAIEAPGNMVVEHPMTELLHGMQDKSLQPSEKYKMQHARSEGTGKQLLAKRNKSVLGESNYEDQLEPVTSGSSDDESRYQKMKHDSTEKKGQNIADRFDIALANSMLSKEGTFFASLNPSGVKLHGKLQQVLQSEKERDANFIRKLQVGFSPLDEQHSFIVEIRSRFLEAKLTVCRCSFVKNIEQSHSSQTLADEERESMIIFSPRVCSHVDLDAGNLIRIHFPWKEVQVLGDGHSIILATYFSCCSSRPVSFDMSNQFGKGTKIMFLFFLFSFPEFPKDSGCSQTSKSNISTILSFILGSTSLPNSRRIEL